MKKLVVAMGEEEEEKEEEVEMSRSGCKAGTFDKSCCLFLERPISHARLGTRLLNLMSSDNRLARAVLESLFGKVGWFMSTC